MNVNLKDITEQRMALQYLLANKDDLSKIIKPKLIKNLVKYLEEVETDLELCGESITELDMSRLDAIEQKNNWLAFIKNGDDF